MGSVCGHTVEQATLTVTIMRCWQPIGSRIGGISSAIVESYMVDVEPCTIANTETVHWVVLDVYIVHGAGAKNFGELDEMIGP